MTNPFLLGTVESPIFILCRSPFCSARRRRRGVSGEVRFISGVVEEPLNLGPATLKGNVLPITGDLSRSRSPPGPLVTRGVGCRSLEDSRVPEPGWVDPNPLFRCPPRRVGRGKPFFPPEPEGFRTHGQQRGEESGWSISAYLIFRTKGTVDSPDVKKCLMFYPNPSFPPLSLPTPHQTSSSLLRPSPSDKWSRRTQTQSSLGKHPRPDPLRPMGLTPPTRIDEESKLSGNLQRPGTIFTLTTSGVRLEYLSSPLNSSRMEISTDPDRDKILTSGDLHNYLRTRVSLDKHFVSNLIVRGQRTQTRAT